MSNKIVFVDDRAKKELRALSDPVQNKFYAQFKVLMEKGRLEPGVAKKIKANLFEIRIKVGGIYRCFYAYIQKSHIVVLHLFQKKTQKTPLKNIKLAVKRLKDYE